MSGHTDRVAEIVRCAMRRAQSASPGEIVWLTDEEAQAMREVRVIPTMEPAMKYVVIAAKGMMHGPFDDAEAAAKWGAAIFPHMPWSIGPVAEAKPPAVASAPILPDSIDYRHQSFVNKL